MRAKYARVIRKGITDARRAARAESPAEIAENTGISNYGLSLKQSELYNRAWWDSFGREVHYAYYGRPF